MLVVLKIPVVYLAVVVWWAVRAQPEATGGDEVGVPAPLTPCGWNEWKRRRPPRPGRGSFRTRRMRMAVRVAR